MNRMLDESHLVECRDSCKPQKKENAVTQKQQIENHKELSEKRIVVLRGSSGIGLAVVQQVVARGARAIIASRNAERVKHAIPTLHGKAEAPPLALSNDHDIP